jgi:hypothetical protein
MAVSLLSIALAEVGSFPIVDDPFRSLCFVILLEVNTAIVILLDHSFVNQAVAIVAIAFKLTEIARR